MDQFASALIDALGGTTKTATLMEAPISTVHNMRTRKLTGSRLNHLRRIAQNVEPPVDVAALADRFGVELEPIDGLECPSSGNTQAVSAEVAR